MRRVTSVAAALVCVAASAPLAADDAQGFLRVVEGEATLIRVEDGQPEPASENTPALAGDRLSLSPGTRVELILPDGHRLRLAESADLELVSLARSLDEESTATALILSDGALAIDVPRDALDRTRVDTDVAGILLRPDGLYLIEIDGRGDTRVVVRAGEAEILGEYDSTLVRAGDEAVVPRDSRAQIALYQAPPLTDVEEWARQLEAEAARAEVAPVDPELRYAAEPLARYGSWVDAGPSRAWRPRVSVGWRPYHQGYWKYSRAGLVWCSYEPWGWVPYHYGSWDLHPSYGWLWYPGRVYRPAHVVWYWGSSHAGWVPSGYYGSFYARRFGFHLSFGSGFYGVSHAGWNAYRDWVFCPTSSIGHRNQYRYHGDHRVLAHRGGFRGSDRAFITADTRGLDRRNWRESSAVEEAIGRRAHRRTGGAGDFPDVSAVVARSPEVSDRMLRDLDRGGQDVRGGGGGRGADGRVATHRPSGPRGAAGQGRDRAAGDPPAAETFGSRQVPAGGAGGSAHRSPGARPRGEQPAAGDLPAADANVPVDRGPRDRAGLRSRPSSGLEVDGAADRGAPAPSDRARAAQPRVLRRAPADDDSRANDASTPTVRSIPRDRSISAERSAPTDRSTSADRTIRTDRTIRLRRSDEASAAGTARSPRPYPTGSQEQRAAPEPRDRVRGAVDRSAPAGPVRAYRERPSVERAAPQPQARSGRSYAPRAAPQPQARAERSYTPRAAPQARAERSYTPRAVPQTQARAERSHAPRAAPQSRAQVERSYTPRAAPQARAERSYMPRVSPQPQARVERSAPRASAPAPRASRESRAPVASSTPARAPRAEASRPAPAARESSRPQGGGGAQARSRDGGHSGGGGAQRRHGRH